MALAGTATFPGFDDILRAEMLFSRGASPSSCLVRVPPGEIAASTGTLTLDDGDGGSVSWTNAAVNRATVRHEHGVSGSRMSVQILDRRWKWRDQEIEGEYNRRLPNGTLVTATRKNARQLATILLTAMGETGVDVTAVPASVFPLADWKCAVPALELERLASSVGCTIVLGRDDKVRICKLGQGASLPVNDNLAYEPAVVTPSRKPAKIRVCMGDVVWQCKWKLEAVGRETNGEIRRIDQLSYRPSAGWGGQWWCQFPDVSVADKPAALESVWRWYRIVTLAEGGLTPRLFPQTVQSIDQHLPLMASLLAPVTMPGGGQAATTAFVEGQFWTQGDTATNCPAGTRYPGDFKLVGEQGIVQFPYPMFRFQSGAIVPADIYLTATCRVRLNAGGYATYGYDRNINGGTAPVHLIRHPELSTGVIQNYSGSSVTGTTTNRTASDAEAAAYATAIASQYSGQWQDHTYLGFEPIDLDGAVAQAQFTVNSGLACSSRFSRMHEFSPFAADAAQRFRREQTDRLLGGSA